MAAVDPATGRIAAHRLTDDARAVFDADYAGEHITHRYAATVHSAQGVTADATHTVPGENTTRALLYVAMTRGRDANLAYLYERATEQEYGPQPAGPHVMRRGTSQQASQLIRVIIASRDDIPVTAHQVAAATPRQLLPDLVAGFAGRRDDAVDRRRTTYAGWREAVDGFTADMARARARSTSRSRGGHTGLEL